MANDLTVSFGGNTSALNAAIDAARRSVSSFSPGATAGAAAGLTVLAEALKQTTSQANQSNDSFLKIVGAVAVGNLIADAFKETAKAAIAVAEGINSIPDHLVSASEATGRYFTSTAQAARSTRLFQDSISGTQVAIGNSILGLHQMIDAVNLQGQGTTQAAMAAIAAAGNFDKLAGAVLASGDRFGSVTEVVDKYVYALAAIPGMTKDAAVSIEAMIATIPNYDIAANDLIIAWLQQVSKTAADAQVNVKALVSTFTAPQGGTDLANMLVTGIDFTNLSTAQGKLEDLSKLASQFRQNFSDPSQGTSFLDALIAKTNALAKAAQDYNQTRIDGVRAANQALFSQDEVGEEVGSTLHDMEASQDKLNVSLQRGVDTWRLMADQARSVLGAQKEIKEFQDVLDASSTPSSQIKELEDKVDKLAKQTLSVSEEGKVVSRVAPDQDLNFTDEENDLAIRAIMGEAGGEGARGEVAVGNVIQNRFKSGRYGDSLLDVLTPDQFNALSSDDPTGALSADPSSLTYLKAKAAWEKVTEGKDSAFLAGAGDIDEDPTKGATHYLNPQTASDLSWYPTMTNKTTIGHQVFGNTPDSPPVLSDDQEKQRREAVQQTNQELQEQKDIEAGGTAEQKSQLALAQQRAAGDVTEVQAAQAKLDVAKQQLQTSGQIVTDGKVATQDDTKATEAKREANSQAYYDAVAGLKTATEKAAIDKASAQEQLAASSAKAAGDVSEVKAAQAKLDAAKQMLAITGQTVSASGKVEALPKPLAASSPQKKYGDDDDDEKAGPPAAATANVATEEQRRTAAEGYYAAVAALRAADQAQDKAVSELKVAQAKEGSQEQLQAKLSEINAEEAAAKGDAAKIAALEKEKLEAIREANRASAANTEETENAKFDALQRTFAQERDQINENAKLDQITQAQKEAQLAASLTRQEQATRDHFAKLAAIQKSYGTDSPLGDIKLAQAQAVALDKLDADRVASARSANDAIAQSYKSSFDQIGQTITSTIMQMIQGQARIRDLVRSVALNIIQQFVEARIKMVADWAAGQVAQVAQTVAAETAKTSATAAGSAARTDLIGVASMEQAALVGVGVIKSILASAAEAFAGIFGFLSPIMGPAAVGPAVAGQATVAAAASAAHFDIGSWSLPSTGLAMVHAGEMIVPAAQTPWAQSLMANANSANAGGSSTQHVHFNVSAIDAGGVKSFFANNSRAILGAINTGVRNGSHLGLMRVGRT